MARCMMLELIDVACRSPQSVAIATELALASDQMEFVSREATASRDRILKRPITNGDFPGRSTEARASNQAAVLASIQFERQARDPDEKYWALLVTSLFASKSQSQALVRSLLPEPKWELLEMGGGMFGGHAMSTTTRKINGGDVVVKFETRGFEWKVGYFLKVENEAELLAKFAGYPVREINRAERLVWIDLNLPKR